MKRIDNITSKIWYGCINWCYDENANEWRESYYNPMVNQVGFFDLTDEEFEILKQGPFNDEIKDGDKVFISKDVKFPKLFIGESGIPIKRSASAKNADKIVISDNTLQKYTDIKVNGEKVYLFHSINDEWRYVSIARIQEKNKTVEDLQRDYLELNWPGVWGDPIPCYILPRTIDESYLEIDKMVLFHNLFHYINSKMTPVTQEIRTNIIGMLRSNDTMQMKLAIDMLKTLDLSGILFDLLWVLSYDRFNWRPGVYHYLEPSVKQSVNFKYIMECLGVNGRDLNTSYGGIKKNIAFSLIKRGMLNDEEKFRVRIGYQIICYKGLGEELSEYQKQELLDNNISVEIDDTDGKATACYKELEG